MADLMDSILVDDQPFVNQMKGIVTRIDEVRPASSLDIFHPTPYNISNNDLS